MKTKKEQQSVCEKKKKSECHLSVFFVLFCVLEWSSFLFEEEEEEEELGCFFLVLCVCVHVSFMVRTNDGKKKKKNQKGTKSEKKGKRGESDV